VSFETSRGEIGHSPSIAQYARLFYDPKHTKWFIITPQILHPKGWNKEQAMYARDIEQMTNAVKELLPMLREENIRLHYYEPQDCGPYSRVTGRYKDMNDGHLKARRALAETATGRALLRYQAGSEDTGIKRSGLRSVSLHLKGIFYWRTAGSGLERTFHWLLAKCKVSLHVAVEGVVGQLQFSSRLLDCYWKVTRIWRLIKMMDHVNHESEHLSLPW
jgi:hypothetical protein